MTSVGGLSVYSASLIYHGLPRFVFLTNTRNELILSHVWGETFERKFQHLSSCFYPQKNWNCTGASRCFFTRPIVSRGWGSCLWIALGRFMFCNEYSIPIHALCDVKIRVQTTWRHNADACCHNSSHLATAPSATPLPCRVPLNGMFHQESTTQWNKLPIWKICNYE